MEVVPYTESKEPDDGAGSSQVEHGDDEHPVQKDEANSNMILLDHGSDGECPGNEKECAQNKSNWSMATNNGERGNSIVSRNGGTDR